MRVDIIHLKENCEGKFYYLASPYTAPIPEVRTNNAWAVMTYSGWFMTEGVYVYSPIWSCHEPARQYNLPTDFNWWLRFNESFIIPSAGIIVCMLDGWVESKGVNYEIEYGRKIGKDIYFFDPDSKEIDNNKPRR